ncbi:MAG: SusC/RagA family TonB-linked outer membrane protein [Tannerellaceae bacterium]|jgi:TonB-linked SusC/RagA family outer membrane protein|nr:SusC/RagA family TonB-linked outer membrane protein [Tannerellaceae bacterium]
MRRKGILAVIGGLFCEAFGSVVSGTAIVDTTLIGEQELAEIVVVGYGRQRRRELTGSISSISRESLGQYSVSLEGVLSGTVPGVSVSQESGQPGSGASIRIRGGNSVHANNDPLYVVDGFIFYNDKSSTQTGLGGFESNLNPLAAINPSDIESIDVLKDVSATAIYGSRGANGVILITTKRGSHEGARVHYRYHVGVQHIAHRLSLLNAAEWGSLQNEIGIHSFPEPELLGVGTDWQNAVLRRGLVQSHELSFFGGRESHQFHVSGGHVGQEGIVMGSSFQRSHGRLNLEEKIKDLALLVTLTGVKSTQGALTTFTPEAYNSSPYSYGISSPLAYALYIPPVIPIYNEDGSYNYHNPYEHGYLSLGGRSVNPLSDLESSVAETIHSQVLMGVQAKYPLSDALTAKVSLGTHIAHTTQNFFAPSSSALGLETQGKGGIGNKRHEDLQTEYSLEYTTALGHAHRLNILGGYTFEQTSTSYAISYASHFTNEELKHHNLSDGATSYPPLSGLTRSTLHSVLGRVNYTFRNRYHLTATFRGDNSSRFAVNHRWGFFPSVGLSWNVYECLKLRVTGGSVGNQEIGDYEAVQSYSAGHYNGQTLYYRNNRGNDRLGWESTEQYNVGVDAFLFSGVFIVTGDVYYKRTRDLLLEIPVSPLEGGGIQLENVGKVTNKGIEVVVKYSPTTNVILSAHLSRNVNRLWNLGANNNLLQGRNQEQILREGEALGSFYGLVYQGTVQSGEDVSTLPKTVYGTPQVGDLKFADLGGPEGKPDGVIDEHDRTVLGNKQAEYTGGVSGTWRQGRFRLYLQVQGMAGVSVYNQLRRFLELPRESYNGSSALLGSATPVGRSRPYSFLDSRYVEDASFVRLRNLSLTYSQPLGRGYSDAAVDFTVTAQNLFTFTRYQGYDPELSSGTDLGTYPTSRVLSFTLALSL